MLTNLPPEIFSHIIPHIRNIEDFTSLTSTCRMLHTLLPKLATPNAILRLCSYSAPTFFSPHPHFLVAATSRRLSSVCLGNPELTHALVSAFESGIDGLYEFCLEHSGITLAEIRKWHLARFNAINPLSDRIDKMAGHQWYATENFWNGGVSEAFTIFCEADRATMQILIYGELFGSSVEAFLDPQNYVDSRMVKPHFGLDVRLEYVKYCIPDGVCRGYPGLEVKRTGPYTDDNLTVADQTALHHVFYCGRWRRLWRGILSQVGPDFWDEEAEEERLEEEQGFIGTRTRQTITLDQSAQQRRQMLWWNSAVLTGGLEVAAIVGTMDKEGRISDETRGRLSELRRKIESLSTDQLMGIKSNVVGIHAKETIAQVPDFAKEVGVCMRSLWPGTEGIFTNVEAETDNSDSDEEGEEQNETDN